MAANKQLTVRLGFIGTVAGSFRRSVSGVNSELGRVGSAISNVQRRQAALRKEMDKQKKLGGVDPRLIHRYRQLGATMEQLGTKAEALRRRQRSLADTGAILSGMWQRLVGGATRLAQVGFQALVVGATAAAAAIGALLTNSSRWSVDLERNARRLGTSTTALQELRVAAAGFGIEADALDDGLADLAERIAEAVAEPEGSVADTFRRIGINAQQLRGMRIEDQLGVVGDALRGLGDEEARLFNARELAGDEGADAILALTREGSAGLRRMRAEAQAGVVSPESQAQLRELAGRFGAVSARVQALGHTIAGELSPVISGWLLRIQKFIDGIDTKQLAADVRSFATTVGKVGDTLMEMFGPIFTDVDRVAQSFGGWGNIAKATVLVVGAALAGVGAVVGDFIGIFIGIHDVTYAVTQSAMGLYYSWQDTFRNMGRSATNAWGTIMSGAQMLRDRATAVVERIKGAFTTAWAAIQSGAAVAMAQVISHVTRVGSTIAQIMRFGRDPESPAGGAPTGKSPTAAAAAGVAAANQRGASNVTNTTLSPTITVNAPHAQSPQQIAALVMREMQRGIITQGAGALTDG